MFKLLHWTEDDDGNEDDERETLATFEDVPSHDEIKGVLRANNICHLNYLSLLDVGYSVLMDTRGNICELAETDELSPQERRLQRGRIMLAQWFKFKDVDQYCPQDLITDVMLALHDDGKDVKSILRMSINNFMAEYAEYRRSSSA